jgi:hypothetical protein
MDLGWRKFTEPSLNHAGCVITTSGVSSFIFFTKKAHCSVKKRKEQTPLVVMTQPS